MHIMNIEKNAYSGKFPFSARGLFYRFYTYYFTVRRAKDISCFAFYLSCRIPLEKQYYAQYYYSEQIEQTPDPLCLVFEIYIGNHKNYRKKNKNQRKREQHLFFCPAGVYFFYVFILLFHFINGADFTPPLFNSCYASKELRGFLLTSAARSSWI